MTGKKRTTLLRWGEGLEMASKMGDWGQSNRKRRLGEDESASAWERERIGYLLTCGNLCVQGIILPKAGGDCSRKRERKRKTQKKGMCKRVPSA